MIRLWMSKDWYCFFNILLQESDGEKSDQDLVVDVANEMVSWVVLLALNGTGSILKKTAKFFGV